MYQLILSNVAKHISLTEEEELFFLSLLKLKTIKRKEFLLKEGDVSRYQTFVAKGCLRTYTIDDMGKEHIVMFSPEDWWSGDMCSFITGKPAAYTIDALVKTDIIQISKNNLEKLYEKIPKFERFFRMLFQNAFVIYQNRITSNLSQKANERHKQFIKTYPGLEQKIAQKYIASFLGVTPEFYSAMKQK
jgi:CRP-like cAMP-binding protein